MVHQTPSRNLRRVAAIAALGALTIVAGCSSVTPAKYAQQGPKFSFRDYFNGTVDAWHVSRPRRRSHQAL